MRDVGVSTYPNVSSNGRDWATICEQAKKRQRSASAVFTTSIQRVGLKHNFLSAPTIKRVDYRAYVNPWAWMVLPVADANVLKGGHSHLRAPGEATVAVRQRKALSSKTDTRSPRTRKVASLAAKSEKELAAALQDPAEMELRPAKKLRIDEEVKVASGKSDSGPTFGERIAWVRRYNEIIAESGLRGAEAKVRRENNGRPTSGRLAQLAIEYKEQSWELLPESDRRCKELPSWFRDCLGDEKPANFRGGWPDEVHERIDLYFAARCAGSGDNLTGCEHLGLNTYIYGSFSFAFLL